MSSTDVVTLALEVSLGLLVFGVGLQASVEDTWFLSRHPGLFLRSVLSINVILPLLALWMVMTFAFDLRVQAALIALSISPLPPFLPLKTNKLGGAASYMVSLLAAESFLAVLLVPLTLWLFGTFFGMSLRIAPSTVVRIVGIGILLPLIAGIALRHVRPSVADRFAKPASVLAIPLLALGLVPLLVHAWHPMLSLVGNGTIGAIVLLAIAGLGVGHLLGGTDPRHQPVLALSTAMRHPAVAVAIVRTVMPDEPLAAAAVLLALITGSLASIPYTMWAKGRIEARGDRTSRDRPFLAQSDHGAAPVKQMSVSPTRQVTPRQAARQTSQRRSAGGPERRRSKRRH
jgi:BASS family bile acid:Na+ symporter